MSPRPVVKVRRLVRSIFRRRWFAYANYSLIMRRTSSRDIPSPNNPSADANGNVHVTPAHLFPGIPQHQFQGGAEYDVTRMEDRRRRIVVAANIVVGGPGQPEEKLPRIGSQFHTSYDLSKNCEFSGCHNLFNRTYYPYDLF